MIHELTREQARRIAVRAQLLTEPRPVDLLEVVRHLALVQSDPVKVVAPSADLVAWSRLGSSYVMGDLEALRVAGSLVELDMMLRPAEDIALFRAEMAAWPGPGPLKEWQEGIRDWMLANDECRRDVLGALAADGPLPASKLPDTTIAPWESSGWNNDRSMRKLLDLMVGRGEIAMAGTEGRERLWDLAERVHPATGTVPLEQAVAERDVRRLRALGIARPKSARTPNEPNHVGGAGAPAAIEGVKGRWRVEPELLDGDFAGRTALLSPIDRLVIDRRRMGEIFGFDYQLEMFKPAAERRWGYWAMPILHGDRLVGKLDATADHEAGVLRVDAVHEDGAWTRRMRSAVDDEISALATWLALSVMRGVLPGERQGR
ncbi:winged helix-turn-helix domain-containing protein [Nocardioides sp. JQ2195]|uniref:DNA glycosylase AlkZ-like family protein n=1 Tax=Nocardioides sp. JQ2195 TaxID=2592334 RepID=UPI00143E4461|nr:crosslink repair DNA glycosylase YcaQ family protein [Nocardioides sp. JQ2195]QIX28400.1 winged helix-turn-helix domain-containing protein [Nocardioides sp. JQ2195]